MARMNESESNQKGGNVSDVAGNVTGSVREAASQVGQTLRDAGSQARDAAQQKYEDLRNYASDYYEQGRQRAVEWEHGLEHYIQEKPLQSLLIAAGVGALFGFLWRRG